MSPRSEDEVVPRRARRGGGHARAAAPRRALLALLAATTCAAAAAGAAAGAAPAYAGPADVLVVGDSLAVGTRPFLPRHARRTATSSTAAKTGITTPQGMGIVRRKLRVVTPKTVVISLGTNDGSDPKRFADRLRRTMALLPARRLRRLGDDHPSGAQGRLPRPEPRAAPGQAARSADRRRRLGARRHRRRRLPARRPARRRGRLPLPQRDDRRRGQHGSARPSAVSRSAPAHQLAAARARPCSASGGPSVSAQASVKWCRSLKTSAPPTTGKQRLGCRTGR